MLTLQNPLPIVSLNLLGIGIDLTLGTVLQDRAAGDEPKEGRLLTLTVNFIVGQYLKSWTVAGTGPKRG